MKMARVVVLAMIALACASGGTKTGGTSTTASPAANTAPSTMSAPTTATAPPRTAIAAPSAPVSRAMLRHAIDSMVTQAEFRNSHFGVLIVDPERGDTLYSLNAGKLFMPASNMKIVTGATSLAKLRPGFWYSTDFGADGTVEHHTLHGDLIVAGNGDPTISDHMRGSAMSALYAVADSLKARGINAITGSVVMGQEAFPDTSIGFGWSWDDLGEDYGAGVDGLYFNEGFGTAIARGTPGQRPDTIETYPAHSYPIIERRPFRPVIYADTGPLRLDFNPTRTTFIAVGSLRTAADTIVYVYPNQRDAYLFALREALVSRGISVNEQKLGRGDSSRTYFRNGSHLFTIESPRLREILPALEKPSQNQIAEILYKTLGRVFTGVGSADSGRVVIERQLAAWGAAPDGYVIRDGSGLSRYDYLSPETIVRVLDKIRADSAFQVFYDALPIAGVDGSLEHRMRGTAAAGNVHAKTGSVANARSLSGYVTTADHHMLLFSLLANNWTVKQASVDSVQSRIAVMLASLNLRDVQ
ncbi:MAG TPA: D-alanyl-D-alanine carboxypeptidase/D-alanyl-D-alanine-endopeptidase [Gemmatimonadaceae bacterium]|nr:D-alanyl-D-alanine carboxypeptidase/D-alanyl-D-alanine-endopeptidase [Gemmatimonadaceae bacterium]